MLRINKLDFQFKDGNKIFSGCNLEIPDNSKTVILGLNGAGKSTLFRIIANEIKNNLEIENTYKNIFYLPQNVFIPKNITSFNYLSGAFFKDNFRWFLQKKEIEKINDVLDKMGLSLKKNKDVNTLSGGEFQKLNIALALLFESDLLLLDEPLSNLDLINQKEVMDVINSIDTTSVIILHDLNIAANFGDNFIGIDKNHKIIQSTKEKFFTPENLKKIFDVNFKVIKNDEKYYIQIID